MLLALVATPLWAEEGTSEEAKRKYDEGLAQYNLAEYGQAIEAFKESYRLSHAPGLLYNIAQSHRLMGDCDQALRVYKNYLREDPGTSNRGKVEDRIAEMEKCGAEKPVVRDAPPVSEIAAESPPVEPSAIAPLRLPAVPLARDASPQNHFKRTLAWTAAAVGLVAIGVAGYYGRDAMQAADEVSERYRERGTWDDHLQSVEERGGSSEFRAAMLGGAGAVALAASGILFLWGHYDNDHPVQARLHANGQMVLSWTF